LFFVLLKMLFIVVICSGVSLNETNEMTVDIDRGLEPVLHRSVHGRDAAQDVQSWPARLPHVAVQSLRLFRRAVQYCRSDLQLQRCDAGARCQRTAMCQTAARLQGYTVRSIIRLRCSHTQSFSQNLHNEDLELHDTLSFTTFRPSNYIAIIMCL